MVSFEKNFMVSGCSDVQKGVENLSGIRPPIVIISKKNYTIFIFIDRKTFQKSTKLFIAAMDVTYCKYLSCRWKHDLPLGLKDPVDNLVCIGHQHQFETFFHVDVKDLNLFFIGLR